MPHIVSVPRLFTLFSQYNKYNRILKAWKLAPIKKMTCYIYMAPHKMPIYIILSAVDTVKCKSVCLSSRHGREYTYGRQYLASRFEIDLIVFPGWPQVSGLKGSCCFSYLNSEHMLLHPAS